MPQEPSEVDDAAMVGWTRGFYVGQKDIALYAVADGLLNALNTLAKKARVARNNAH